MTKTQKRIEKRMIKIAQSAVFSGKPEDTGDVLAYIIQFILKKVDFIRRPHYTAKLKEKIWNLNENEMGGKKSPQTASLGQAITFIKTILNGQPPSYIRAVLAQIMRVL